MAEPYHAINHRGIWFLVSYTEIYKNIIKPKLLNYLRYKFQTLFDFKEDFWGKKPSDFLLYFLRNTLFFIQKPFL